MLLLNTTDLHCKCKATISILPYHGLDFGTVSYHKQSLATDDLVRNRRGKAIRMHIPKQALRGANTNMCDTH